jgi:hypothetical protein
MKKQIFLSSAILLSSLTFAKSHSPNDTKIKEELLCAQIITSATNTTTGEIIDFPSPCDVPKNWTTIRLANENLINPTNIETKLNLENKSLDKTSISTFDKTKDLVKSYWKSTEKTRNYIQSKATYVVDDLNNKASDLYNKPKTQEIITNIKSEATGAWKKIQSLFN